MIITESEDVTFLCGWDMVKNLKTVLDLIEDKRGFKEKENVWS